MVAFPWRVTSHGLRLQVYLQPRAANNRLVGCHGESLKIAVTAPPIEGTANAALLRFLAALLEVPLSSVSLLGGAKSRKKQVLIHTTDANSLIQGLTALLERVDKKNRDD